MLKRQLHNRSANDPSIRVAGFVRAACPQGHTCDPLFPKQMRCQTALHPDNTAGGSRTHNVWFLRPAPLPVGLQQHTNTPGGS